MSKVRASQVGDLTQIRVAAGLGKLELHKLSGLSRSTIDKIEKNEPVGIKTIVRFLVAARDGSRTSRAIHLATNSILKAGAIDTEAMSAGALYAQNFCIAAEQVLKTADFESIEELKRACVQVLSHLNELEESRSSWSSGMHGG